MQLPWHGAQGGDELNQPQAGHNYGWPVITYGVDYSGARIGEGSAKAGMEQPVYYWDPIIAPSSAVFYTGSAFPAWHGDLFVSSLKPGVLVRLRLDGGRVTEEERWGSWGNVSARWSKGRTGCCICSPTAVKAASYVSSRTA